MNRLRIVVPLIMLACWPVDHTPAENQILKVHLFPTPFKDEAICFTCALGEIGVRLQGGYVLFGVEMREKGGKEPTVDLNVAEGATLGEALLDVLRQMPGYKMQVISDHMIDIYPQGARDDPKDALNLHVKKFDFVDDRPSTLLGYPQAYIAELAKLLVQRSKGPPYPVEYPGFMLINGLEPRATLQLQNVTVRQILNAASEAAQAFPADHPPLCWSSTFHADSAWAVGGTYSWRAFACVPRNWKDYVKPVSPYAKPN